MNASVNIYMFHGGTNFGFTSGWVKFTTYFLEFWKKCLRNNSYTLNLLIYELIFIFMKL